MTDQAGKKPHVTFLFSDTGGGHRAACEAIIEAVHCVHGDDIEMQMVDFLKEYAPPPFNRLPEIYPDLVKAPELWGAMFDISDGRPQARIITSSFWPYVRRAVKHLLRDNDSDMVVCAHPVANSFILKALGKEHPPFITVVTDMVSTHALWYDKRADLILVPTEMARKVGIQYNMEPEKIHVVGQPVSQRCSEPAGKKMQLRERLGWPTNKQVVLLVGGGEGMGPLAETASFIDQSGLDLCLVIVAGRNSKLEAEMKEKTWDNPAFIYGFTHDMPDFMRAADVIVTKAGPGTIAEALIADLPIILYAKLPGQEDGNVDFVVSEGVGVWAPDPLTVVRTLTRWICRKKERELVVKNCRRVARPDASRQIALYLGAELGLNENPAESQTSHS